MNKLLPQVWFLWFYFLMLAGVIIVGFLVFDDLHHMQADQDLTTPEAEELYEDYAAFLKISTAVLALALGSGAGFCVILYESISTGVLIVVLGIALTAFGFGFLPDLYVAGVEYTAPFVWANHGVAYWFIPLVLFVIMKYIWGRRLRF